MAPVGTRRRNSPPTGVPVHLAHLWDTPLLRPEEETDLFRRMNFLKYRANSLRATLRPSRPNVRVMDRIESMLLESRKIRNHITRANLRLVVSIARRFLNNSDSLEELVSDGNLILMRAVDRFDYSRGFRFSTYATHAIQREFYRRYSKGRRRMSVEVCTEPDVLVNSVVAPETSAELVAQTRQAEHLKHLINSHLGDRERDIVKLRLGLDSDGGAKTLREVGERLGISKERVRQLQSRALNYIRSIAETHSADFESPGTGLPA
ncbi:MAG: sigma-70 family RNA polymerase sigma factor [Fuerstiella sp.]